MNAETEMRIERMQDEIDRKDAMIERLLNERDDLLEKLQMAEETIYQLKGIQAT
jgi:hypothetical protein